ncbi:hypothetical protein CH64_1864 [Yersinia rohdei]|uniref:Uncharacterized protein n=1 Tax=Yersinia rohdei TaxID=29485 RepID=A0A0U1HQN5_YERRO|nr:hypothetical protein [Yersinia rohdei]AJJ10608.1 hypothetical protein CH64_1864 [Yersinia rohdei]MDN0095427.1 hypothetical protein [Yersinia rohdei]CNF20937.1 Uncharacterised protein [Yersinia rohdei]CNI51134.1 Uncharacterised protein [Yersinia rohdei]CQI88853.1 Uncharacterised protein [Yersinia rohdei]
MEQWVLSNLTYNENNNSLDFCFGIAGLVYVTPAALSENIDLSHVIEIIINLTDYLFRLHEQQTTIGI